MVQGYAGTRLPGNIGRADAHRGSQAILIKSSSFLAAQKGSTKKLGQYRNYIEQRNDTRNMKIFLFVHLRGR